ncbi:exodeoxyribonuclease V subunit alpha [Veronia nyctiphanis]|uniref:RecBCD enzyme subunit RecD n=1 Tax=Veronia nyctiphanis TaxID=1278244 RepID=A0A4Q0YNL2_9GAMM|nr:exodeoxyribonuclease V subunit alpha [Veronia nyctiphanis]RXJ72537.1 exodeoxyribonuclease V subunit alpha [Veronia nyctiphanis]
MRDRLNELHQANVLRAIDYQFCLFIAGQETQACTDFIAGWAALVSYELGKGNVCVDLAAIDPAALFDLPSDQSVALASVLKPEVACEKLKEAVTVSDGTQPTPLVMQGSRLYLNRYWQAEQTVAQEIQRRCLPVAVGGECHSLLDELFTPDIRLLKKLFSTWSDQERVDKVRDFFDVMEDGETDIPAIVEALSANKHADEILSFIDQSDCLNWQKVAAATSLSYGFSVISGGPGTGKTTTVAKLLAALISGSTKYKTPEIKLVAPTGKAANRLTESIGRAVEALPVSAEVKAKIPVQASTIHRLLGAIPNRVEFRHHQGNRLHLDILVVDEASMVDLPLMARMLSALPEHARVLLLGDRDQLASVEAGAVLGDICQSAAGNYSQQRAELLSQMTGFQIASTTEATPVNDSVCLLQKSFRFHAQSGIGQLAGAINAGSINHVSTVLRRGYKDINHHELDNDTYLSAISQAADGYTAYLKILNGVSTKTLSEAENESDTEAKSAQMALKAFSACRVLCALADGPFGVVGLNRAIEDLLAKRRLISPGDEMFYPGRPVMVMQNDHGLGLYNGDIGVVVEQSDDDGERLLRVAFEMADGSIRFLLPSRLPEHQTAYAMTVHKSQGSEFAHTILVLPPTPTPVMTRELVYTGVTRAKERLDIFTTRSSMKRAVERKTQRFSGLAALLAG